MATRYVCLKQASLDDILNSKGVVLIYRQKDLTIYQPGSSDHINQLFRGLGDTMHGESISHMNASNSFMKRRAVKLTPLQSI